jgi:hypothetical protein
MINKSFLSKPVSGSGTIPSGTNTGDIIRWNAGSGAYEAVAEPFILTQVNLKPAAAAPSNYKGGMYFSSLDDSVYVCTSAA